MWDEVVKFGEGFYCAVVGGSWGVVVGEDRVAEVLAEARGLGKSSCGVNRGGGQLKAFRLVDLIEIN